MWLSPSAAACTSATSILVKYLSHRHFWVIYKRQRKTVVFKVFNKYHCQWFNIYDNMESSKAFYQKPLLFSNQLPYSDKLEAEANEMFDRIKKNLSLAVQRRELWPGAMYWSYRLQRCVHGWLVVWWWVVVECESI